MPAKFKPGDRVRAKNIHPATHTRLPRYARGHIGVIERDLGCHVFPDSAATESGENPQWLYTVVFDGPRAVGTGRRPDVKNLDRCLRALSGGGLMDTAATRPPGALPGIPRDGDGPVFREPWEAQAFAMALTLHERGLFTWNEWAATLADEIKRAQPAGDPDTGETYYRHWLATLERLIAEKGITTAAPCTATATPGTTLPTARRMASRSYCGRRISSLRRASVQRRHARKQMVWAKRIAGRSD